MEDEKYIPRDLSWLSFNYRVLMEAQDESVPLLERLRFLAIYSSNLDEFFRVRVADIRNLIRIDKKKINKSIDIKPKKLLKLINQEVNKQLEIYGDTLRNDVLPKLRNEGVIIYSRNELSEKHLKEIEIIFRNQVAPYLQPYIEGISEREPFLKNQGLYLCIKLQSKSDSTEYYGYLNIPSDSLKRFHSLSKADQCQPLVMLDDIVILHLDRVFPGFKVLHCYAIKLNKDADLQIEDEYSGDLVEKIQKQVKKRDLGIPSRLLYDKAMPEDMLQWLVQKFDLQEDDLIPGGNAHNLNDYFQISNSIGKHLEYPSFETLEHSTLRKEDSLIQAMEERDYLLHFPYQSYDYIIQLFSEAALDPEIGEINVAFYRMAANSLLGESLISAARNGKSVMVFMELKARFDEENNIRWAERFKDAGVTVVYSIPGIKVHAKIALFTKRSGKETKRYGFFGTGNLNEKTARIYADYGLLTCNPTLTSELEEVFYYLRERKEPKPFQNLLVSQFNLMDDFKKLIDFEIAEALQGRPAHIVIKLNNLEEKTMIDKLYEASQAGVVIKMIVRGICCLMPGVPGLSENIEVRRIVDRYLEHARAFIFHHGGKEKIYLGSADWMNRNLYSRVEVAFPVTGPAGEEIKKVIEMQLEDDTSAVLLDAELNNHKIQAETAGKRAQFDTYRWLKEKL